MTPEQEARILIDEQLTRAGWFVCDRKDIDMVNKRGNAVREAIVAADLHALKVIALEIAEEL